MYKFNIKLYKLVKYVNYVLWLQQKQKWHRSAGDLKEGIMVVIKEKSTPICL